MLDGQRVRAVIVTLPKISTGAKPSLGSSIMGMLVRYRLTVADFVVVSNCILTLGGESKLTTAALLRHDAVQGGLKLGAGEEDDVTGVTHKTFDTFASDWSGCTNVAFDKVINKF